MTAPPQTRLPGVLAGRAPGLQPEPEPTPPPPSSYRGQQRPPGGYIRFRVAEVALDNGVVLQGGPHKGQPNLSAISRGTDLAYTTVSPLLRSPDDIKAISLETLARLCDYFQCVPGDILEYVPNATPSLTPPSPESGDREAVGKGVSSW